MLLYRAIARSVQLHIALKNSTPFRNGQYKSFMTESRSAKEKASAPGHEGMKLPASIEGVFRPVSSAGADLPERHSIPIPCVAAVV